uniref:G_PROTEIN_RECEP_F1_2 domain-containing protein n=1 Tax=Elaeophora elaphi TaxID=1147741 RepID=A0A0R3RNA2_9BILA
MLLLKLPVDWDSFYIITQVSKKIVGELVQMARLYYIIILFLILPLNCEERNATYVFDIRDESNVVMKYVAVIMFTLCLLYAIVGNVLLMVVICSRENLYSRALILNISQLIICHFSVFFLQIGFILPEILKAKNSSGEDYLTWIHSIFSSFDTFLFIASLQFIFLLAVNRFVVLILPKFNTLFETKFSFLIGSVWLLAFGKIH